MLSMLLLPVAYILQECYHSVLYDNVVAVVEGLAPETAVPLALAGGNPPACLLSLMHAFWSADSAVSTVFAIIMKGTKVQTLGARAIAGAWCMADCLGHNYYGHGYRVQLLIRVRTAN